MRVSIYLGANRAIPLCTRIRGTIWRYINFEKQGCVCRGGPGYLNTNKEMNKRRWRPIWREGRKTNVSSRRVLLRAYTRIAASCYRFRIAHPFEIYIRRYAISGKIEFVCVVQKFISLFHFHAHIARIRIVDRNTPWEVDEVRPRWKNIGEVCILAAAIYFNPFFRQRRYWFTSCFLGYSLSPLLSILHWSRANGEFNGALPDKHTHSVV